MSDQTSSAGSRDPSRCPLCGKPNQCGMVAGKTTCWCTSVTIPKAVIDLIPSDARGVACVCPECATGAHLPAKDKADAS
jgi:hypothetical protein